MEIVFLGYPGSGKGTQASLLSRRYQIPQISTGDMLRAAVHARSELGKKAQDYLDRGALVPDEVMIRLVEQRIGEPDAKTGYILDGFPRTLNQAQQLDRVLREHDRELTAVISLEIEKGKVVTRLTSRRVCRDCGKLFNLLTDPPPANDICDACGGAVYQRSDDKPETVLHRIEVYEESTRPLKDYYSSQGKLLEIDAGSRIDEIQSEIVRRLESLA